jgi:hypothetical protein
VVRRDDRRAEIDDPAAITDLLAILRDANPVSAHHSSPRMSYDLFFPEIAYRYSLRPDSDVRDEYWLDWAGYPGSDPHRPPIATLRQVQSEQIGAWLARYVLDSAGAGPAGHPAPTQPAEANSTGSATERFGPRSESR